jgi:hypothetical protein
MNQKKTPTIRRYFCYTVLFLLLFILLTAAAYLGIAEYGKYSMKALNCEISTAEKFEKSIALNLKRQYVASDGGASSVTLHLDIPSASAEKFVLIISSNKTRRNVYHGKFESTIPIKMGIELTENDGYDGVVFGFYNRMTYEICSFVHEASFWQPNKKVFISLLPYRETNEIGLPVAFKVRVE